MQKENASSLITKSLFVYILTICKLLLCENAFDGILSKVVFSRIVNEIIDFGRIRSLSFISLLIISTILAPSLIKFFKFKPPFDSPSTEQTIYSYHY